MTFTSITISTAIATLALLVGGESLTAAQALPTKPTSTSLSTKAEAKLRPPISSVQLPMAFEASGGQKNGGNDFVAQGPGYRLALSPREATFQLANNPTTSRQAPQPRARPVETLTMQLVGADASAHAVRNPHPTGHANYFLGKDPGKWRTDIPLFARVEYRQVYQGVDLVYYGNERQLEYDFLVRAGTDPKRISLKFGGARSVRIAGNGDLVLGLSAGRDLRWHRPVSYQTIAGKKRLVASSFVLRRGREVGFALARYDTTRPLVIDPKLIYSKSLGNPDISATTLAIDSVGNTYIGGALRTAAFPVTPGAFQTVHKGGFIAKLNPTGTAFLYATYLGGSDSDSVNKIALDSQGNIYATGSTVSNAFPVTPGAFQITDPQSPDLTSLGRYGTVFVCKLNPSGSALLYSTYLGGRTTENSNGIAIDNAGNAYITGVTVSPNFPTTPGAFQRTSHSVGISGDSFITKLNPTGTGLIYSTLFGGDASTQISAFALGSAGDVYITGGTSSTDFPVTPGAFQTIRPTVGGDANSTSAFVARLNSTGTALVYSTYLGGSKPGDETAAIVVDRAGAAYITGVTLSTDFPTTPGAYRTTLPGVSNVYGYAGAFVTKLNPAGSALIYSTYLGFASTGGIAIDGTGGAYVTGTVVTAGFPTTVGSLQRNLSPGTNPTAFVARLNNAGTALVYSSYLPDDVVCFGIAVDNMGTATVCGISFVTRLSTHPIFPDFNADGNTDLLLQNSATGSVGAWFLNGPDVQGGTSIFQIPPPTYTLVGAGDFRADGATTLVFQNSVDNGIVFWYTTGINNAGISGMESVRSAVAAGWKLVGIADFNQDGRSDLLFQNQTTGKLVIWFMNGSVFQGGVAIPQAPGSDWKVAGTGDTNGDGSADIVFQNQTTGALRIWFMQGTAYAGEGPLTATLGPGWNVVGIGDYDNDGKADLLLQNSTTRQAAIWYLNGTVVQGSRFLSWNLPANWNIVGPH